MKNNKALSKLTRKFLISIFTMIYALVAVAQVTFAWIEMGNEFYLDDASIGISGDYDFYVSLDGVNYSHSIKNDEFKKVLNNTGLIDITSSDGINFYDKSGKFKVDQKTNYISFPLYFKTKENMVSELYLVDNLSKSLTYDQAKQKVDKKELIEGTFIVSKGVLWKPDADFHYRGEEIKANKTKELTCYAANAIRISVVEQLIEEDKSANEELLSFIYDPTEDPTNGFGVKSGAYEYYEKKMGESLTLPFNNPVTIPSLSVIENRFGTDDPTSMCAKFRYINEVDDNGVVRNSAPWKYAKVIVNIWLEGWDSDCFNSIMNDDSILIQLRFKGSELKPQKVQENK